MTDSQSISNPVFTGQSGTPTGKDLAPNGPGVDFTTTSGSIRVPFAPGVTPIVTQVTVPPKNTNVNQITVTVTSPSGAVLFGPQTSPTGNKVTNFPATAFPANSILTVTFTTSDGQPPQNVTLSVIACYTPSTAATVVSTGTPTGVPTATTVSSGTAGTGPQTTLVITTTTAGGVTGMSSTKSVFTQSGFQHR